MRESVIIHVDPLVGGGVGRAAQDLCREEGRRGGEVELFYTRSEYTLCPIERSFYRALRSQAATK